MWRLVCVVATVSSIVSGPRLPAGESAAAKCDRLRADLAAGEKEFADLERQLAAKKTEIEELRIGVAMAERERLAETAGEAAGGEPEKIESLLDRIDGLRVVDLELAAPFAKGKVPGGKLAPVIDRKFKAAAEPVCKAKLCWILGVSGTPEAAALLREYLASEKDPTVLSNAMQALAACGSDEKNVAAIRAFLGRKERPAVCYGYYSAVTLDEQAARLAGRPDAKNAATPGEVIIEEPTALSLGLEWKIEGDANLNCRVDVAYRRAGEGAWKPAMPLLRVEPGGFPGTAKAWEGMDPGNLLAGSILFLDPATEYEVRLSLSDPDGGKEERIVKAKTRSEPAVPADMNVRHVVPGTGGGSGTEADPFKGIEAAHAAAQPGDLFLLAPGTYAGPFVFTKSGSAGKPIVWRGADRDKVILDGGGKERALNLNGLKHVFIEKLTVRNGGKMGVTAVKAEWVVIRRCRIFDCGYGGVFAQGECRNLTVTDNSIEGPAAWEQKGSRKSCYGVCLNGEGHILAHNAISEWWDCISLASDNRTMTRSVDVYGNEIAKATDDGFEGDNVRHNVRVFRNRITNVLCALSCQPVYGGPSYFVGNCIYNARLKPYKFHVDPTGMIVAHNTAVTAGRGFGGGNWHNAIFRNNLILGTQNYAMDTDGDRADFDYNGWSKAAPDRFIKFNNVRYFTLEDFSRFTGHEAHGRMVSLADFAKAEKPHDEQTGMPKDHSKDYFGKAYAPDSQDLRLKDGSGAIDAGVPLPNLNDGFTGKAPDLGCYEAGQPAPRYGPRPE